MQLFESVNPVDAPYVPSGHGSGTIVPSGQYEPYGQIVGDVIPSSSQ